MKKKVGVMTFTNDFLGFIYSMKNIADMWHLWSITLVFTKVNFKTSYVQYIMMILLQYTLAVTVNREIDFIKTMLHFN